MAIERKADVVLIVVVVGLAVLALLPEAPSDPQRRDGEPESTTVAENVSASTTETFRDDRQVSDRLDETLDAVAQHRSDLDEVNALTRQTQPMESTRKYAPPIPPTGLGPVMPIGAGAIWRYRLYGDSDFVTGDSWTMRIVSEPEGEGPGVVEARMGEVVQLSPLYCREGSLRFAGLPFIAPEALIGTRTVETEGELLPPQVRLIDGAVWNDTHFRRLLYSYSDDRGRSHELKADATIRNRAHVRGFETVIVPAGRFGAYRIEWISRVDIKAEGRPILEHLTVEPYRRETMWVAPGIGIVKREIDFITTGEPTRTVTLALETYTPAGDCVFQDL